MPSRLLDRLRARLAAATQAAGAPSADEDTTLRAVPDDLPRDQLFAQPLVVDHIDAKAPERLGDGSVRVHFVVRVRDAEDKRCPDLAVEVTLTGPERTAGGLLQTDMLGHAGFRMTGPPGTYRLTIDDVAAGALGWDRDASVTTATIEA